MKNLNHYVSSTDLDSELPIEIINWPLGKEPKTIAKMSISEAQTLIQGLTMAIGVFNRENGENEPRS